jgi:hypothetical protein
MKGAEFWLDHVLAKRDEEDATQRRFAQKTLKEKVSREVAPSPPKKRK